VVVGLNVIFTAQEAPGAMDAPHAELSTVYAPVVTNGGTGSGPLATLVRVRVLEEAKPTS
jgi:hypothetical protein